MSQIEQIVAELDTGKLRAALLRAKFSGKLIINVRPNSMIKQIEVVERVPVKPGEEQQILESTDWIALHRNPDTQEVGPVERRYLFKYGKNRLPA